ncbi:CLUMA_CG019399, isoform A [Clunio marinus]|uniref:CLUMA_CG019399, isoform A n=1 Tax=Clunio marinus TaxID=568069 RepID=A0A1J1J2L4_9DIPT|nr:CLUMA_CG019399, isoform A [Clunio marinus]
MWKIFTRVVINLRQFPFLSIVLSCCVPSQSIRQVERVKHDSIFSSKSYETVLLASCLEV